MKIDEYQTLKLETRRVNGEIEGLAKKVAEEMKEKDSLEIIHHPVEEDPSIHSLAYKNRTRFVNIDFAINAPVR